MHRIKKYTNRKMYDATANRYVTMDDIAELVESGESITIIDNASKQKQETTLGFKSSYVVIFIMLRV